MTVDRFIAALFGSAETTATVSAFLLGQYATGWTLTRLLGLRAPPTISFHVAAGLAINAGICWYVYAINGTPKGALPLLLTFGFSALALLPMIEARPGGGNEDPYEPAPDLMSGKLLLFVSVILAVSIFFHAISPTGETALVLLTNNDPYAWAMVADHSRSVLADIYGASEYWSRMIGDASGTYSLLALLADMRGSTAFEALPYFLIAIASLICVATYELCLFICRMKPMQAFLVALSYSTSTFYFYVYLNGFLGELVGTFAALAAIGTSLWGGFEPAKSRQPRLGRGAFALSFPIALLLIGYQAGFVPFAALIVCTTFAIVFCVQLPGGSKAALRSAIERSLPPIFVAIIAVSGLLLQIAVHLIERTSEVLAGAGAWRISTIDPRHFLGVFWLGAFGEGRGTPPHYLIFWFDAGLLALFLRRGARTPRTLANAGALAAFLGSVFLYLVAFAIRGPIYQVWKFAAYTVLPLGFVPLGAALALLEAYPGSQGSRKRWREVVPTAVGFVLAILSLATWIHDNRPTSLAILTANLRDLSTKVDGSAGVVLDMSAYRNSMVAMNLLHPSGPIVPLQLTYLPATALNDPVLERSGLTVIRVADCAERRQILFRDLPPAPAHPVRYVAEAWASTGDKSFYSFGASSCVGNSSWSVTDDGLSLSDERGRWSTGPQATLKIAGFPAQSLLVKIRLEPFVFGERSQRLGVTVNGRPYGTITASRQGILSIPVPAWLNNREEITLAFSFPDHVERTVVDPTSRDHRDVAFEYIDFPVTTAVNQESANGDALRATFNEY